MNLKLASDKPLSTGFKWRDRRGKFHFIQDMVTRHLFFVVRMIWNHTMDEKIGEYQQYRFSSFYTQQYLQESIRFMVPELLQRDNLTASWRRDLQRMAAIVNKQRRLPHE